MGIDVMADMSTAQHAVSCPMGACLGCEYATECSRPGRQAAYLRAEVERLKRERAVREADSLAALTEWAEKYRDARRAAMEEAAGIASGFVTVADPHTIQVLCGRIVSAIRAAAKEG